MSEESANLLPARAVEPKPPVSNNRAGATRGGSGAAIVLALLALIVGGVALWRAYVVEHGQAEVQAGLRGELGTRLDEIARGEQQRKHDLDAMRARLTDADGINKAMREEMLALGERSRHLEDAVANLAEQRLTGRDALALNEAEFLLQQAQERLALFGDAQAAVAAYRLADSALAAAEDPVFSSVRQTINAELHALEASKPVETQAAIVALERVRAALPGLPVEHTAAADAAPASGWQGFFAQFVRISHSSDADTGASRNVGLNRSLAALDLRAAEAALLARDADGYKVALARARAGIVAGFDAQAAPTKAALAEIDRFASQPLAPALPELGSALKELRNLRATRALAQPRPASPAQTPTPTPTNEDQRGASAPDRDEADA